MEHRSTLTVTELNEYIKILLDSQPLLSKLFVVGEISNFTDHRSGHLYFTLKDKDSAVRAVMFRSYASRLAFRPENGMKVIVRGSVSAFPRDGQYQVYVEDIQPDGAGTLFTAFEQLKKRLEAKGLFDRSLKKKIPEFPERVGIITSPTGAAIRDMLNISARRCPMAEIVVYPSLVQGSSAPKNLIEGIKYFNAEKSVDVIIIGRGGGSIEDLWAFNNEQLAYAVAESEIPIISAVGHETDFTICDFVADLRAPTPSAAAELALPDCSELSYELSAMKTRLKTLVKRITDDGRDTLELLSRSKIFTSPETYFNTRRLLLDRKSEKLDTAIVAKNSEISVKLREKVAKLEAMNPLAVLSRGYGAVSDEKGATVTRAEQLEKGQKINITFSDGRVSAEITEGVKQ